MQFNALSTKDLEDMLKAVNDLERKYKDKKRISRYSGEGRYIGSRFCPLCQLVGYKSSTASDFRKNCVIYCPWGVIEGIRADNFLCHTGGYRNQSTEERLHRVARWQSLIKEAISAKTKKI